MNLIEENSGRGAFTGRILVWVKTQCRELDFLFLFLFSSRPIQIPINFREWIEPTWPFQRIFFLRNEFLVILNSSTSKKGLKFALLPRKGKNWPQPSVFPAPSTLSFTTYVSKQMSDVRVLTEETKEKHQIRLGIRNRGLKVWHQQPNLRVLSYLLNHLPFLGLSCSIYKIGWAVCM